MLINSDICCTVAKEKPSPKSYRALLDELEDLRLQVLAEERISNDNGITIPANEVYAELGILSDDNDEISFKNTRRN